jgi:hypothetical protein
MIHYVKRCPALVLAGVLAAGCGRGDNPPAAPADKDRQGAEASGEKYRLAAEPAGAKGVTAVREQAKDGDEVVVVGRIGGNAKPWVEGRAAFWIVDPSLKSCKETEDDDCPTPWDYCCTPREDLVKGMATVKVVDDKGQTVATDARQLLGVKELQTVVVRGRAKRDAEGNLTVLASGVYRRPEANK